MDNLHYYFEHDSSHCCKIPIKMQPPFDCVEMYLLVDFNSTTMYVSTYFKNPHSLDFYKSFINYITDENNATQQPGEYIKLPSAKFSLGRYLTIKNENPLGISSKFFSGDIQEELDSLTLSLRIYIYAEDQLSSNDLCELIEYGKFKKRRIKFLSKEYLKEIEAYNKHPVAFISHDSRDKSEIAEPLARKLIKLGFPVWYDEYSLQPGDSLTESIDIGIKKCNKCILILSPNFFSNTGWCKEEFKAAYIKKINSKGNIIIPIWANVTKQDVYNYHAALADIFAINWGLGIEEVCKKLGEVLD